MSNPMIGLYSAIPARVLARLTATVLTAAAACGGEPPTGRSAPPSPAILEISPVEGPIRGGTRLTITGRGFHEGATVLIGGTPATDVGVGVAGGDRLTATAPVGRSPCAVSVMVINPDGRFAMLPSLYRYLPDGPDTGDACRGPWDY